MMALLSMICILTKPATAVECFRISRMFRNYRAEEAEMLVNVGRFAAGLRIQQGAWDTSRITTAIKQQIQWISVLRNPVS